MKNDYAGRNCADLHTQQKSWQPAYSGDDMYFVLLNHPSVKPGIFMTETDSEDVAFFSNLGSAIAAAKDNTLGEHFGFTVFNTDDDGECH